MTDLKSIAESFGAEVVSEISEISSGHINSTYHVPCSTGVYIMQSLNSSVFKDAKAVMRNIAAVQDHFEKTPSARVRVPHYLCTAEGLNHAVHGEKLYRMYRCAEPECVARFGASGFALGEFLRVMSLSSFEPEPSIDGFHDYNAYFAKLEAACRTDKQNCIPTEIISRLRVIGEKLETVFTDSIPKRIIHGDAKIGNMILGSTSTIIDLDTVMYGWAAIDFGDLVRSVFGIGSLDDVWFRMLAEGFADGLDGTLTGSEVSSLYYGILYVTAELAVRYLTDYISEGCYFKGKTPRQCLERAEYLLSQLDMFTASRQMITEVLSHVLK